jgi:uncharacterized membrane protein
MTQRSLSRKSTMAKNSTLKFRVIEGWVHRAESFVEKHALPLVLATGLVFFIVFLTIALHRFWQYATWYYDFGIFYQAIAAFARGDAPIIDHLIVPNKHIFADHFHPLIMMVVPFFYFVPRPETLHFVQTLSVALSGIVMFYVGKAVLKNTTAAFLFTLLYYSFFGLHFALITEFHEIALLPLPLSIFFLGMVRKSWLPLGVGFVGVLLAKETTFIIPAWFGLVMLWQYPRNRKFIGAVVSILSLVYGYLVLKVIIPAYSGSEYYYASGVGLGSTLETLPTLISHSTIWKVFASQGFLPFLAPETLPPILFNWWSRVQTGGPRIGIGMHYNAELAPTLALGAMIGWLRLQSLLRALATFVRPRLQLKSVALVRAYVAKLALTLGWNGALAITVALLCFVNIYVYKSPALLFTNPAFYAHTSSAAFLDRLIAKIPPTGTVMAQHNIAARLAYRKVYMLRNYYDPFEPDFIVFDTRAGQEPNNFFGIGDWEELVEKFENDPVYELYYDQGEQFIYKKKAFLIE